MIYNQTHELIYVNPISLVKSILSSLFIFAFIQFSFPDDYSRMSFYQRKITQLDTQILDSSIIIFLIIFNDNSK